MKSRKVYIIEAKRTAIGKFLGSLYGADPAEVAAQVIKNGFVQKNYNLKDIECVIIGNVISAGVGQGIARKIAVSAGIPEHVPAYSVNMVCGSGMQAIRNGMNEIRCGSDLILCGGFEFMSNIPFAMNSQMRTGRKLGDFALVDLMTHDGLTDSFSNVHMGITAENIAMHYEVTREEQDKYAYLTQQRAISAVDSGVFIDEIVPVVLHDNRGKETIFDIDEFPNRHSTLEKLAALKPSFKMDGTGTVTAGNSSGINDGAAFVLLASQEYCEKHDIKPLAELVEATAVGCDPQYMGLGPYYAIKKLLEMTKVSFDKIDYMEVNEAFAAQILGCYKLMAKEYGVTVDAIIEKSNLYGSGLGLGHPLGATGARITTTLAHVMKEKKGKYGVASLCIGGGMGAALLLRSVD